MRSIYEPFQRRFRPRRLRLFYSKFKITRETRVLDLGGGLFFWELAKREELPQPQVTILNIRPQSEELPPGIVWVCGNATRACFPDSSFDVVFSNSLVEHLGSWGAQVQFAEEVRRLARSYFIQTPNKWFFVEPHFVTPFTHWLPMAVRRKLGPRATVWGWMNKATRSQYENQLSEIRLLGLNDMRTLFPEARLIIEPWMGMAKSIVAIGEG